MKLCKVNCYSSRQGMLRASVTAIALASSVVLQAQDGSAGLNEANTEVRGYFAAGTSLMYGIGGIVAIVGAIKVYQKWSAGDPETGKVAAAWFGACVFLVVVATVIKSFFGIA